MSFHNLVNTAYFTKTGTDFFKNGEQYTTAPRGSRDYYDFWEEEERRCLQGYQVGDLYITGRHYFYLNFTPIWRVPDEVLFKAQLAAQQGKTYNVTAERVLEFPKFWEIDYEWWNFKHIAWFGGEFMGIFSPGGRHVGCLKSRGAGFSYKEAADGVYNFLFIEGSKSYYFAGLEEYLIKDGILNKVQEMLDHINKHSPYWKLNRGKKNTLMHQKATYLDETGMEVGVGSEIFGVTIDNPNKAHPYSTNIFTPDGMRKWGDIQAGDSVFGSNGKPIKVLDTYEQGEQDIYTVIFDDGRKVQCTYDHLWTVSYWSNIQRKGVITTKLTTRTLPLNEIAHKLSRSSSDTNRIKVQLNGPVEYAPSSVPIDAYTMGLMLGDGSIGNSTRTTSHLTMLYEDVEAIKPYIPYEVLKENWGTGIRNKIMIPNGKQIFKDLGLFDKRSGTKFIPEKYKYNSIAVRLAVLNGLLDTDGSVTRDFGVIEYCSKSLQLAEDVLWIARSLGFGGTRKTRQIKGTNYYRVYIYCNPSELTLFNLPRKRDRIRIKKFNKKALQISQYVNIKSVEFSHRERAKCIRVDAADSLYLVEDHIVTHNTRGKRGRKVTFEEAGSFKNLKQALEISMGSIKDGSIYVGQISVFGCVCAGTEVYKANGDKVLIENLKQEDGILGYNGTSVSQEEIVWMQPPTRKECVEILLETGISLRCSVDHPILSTNTGLKARTRPSGIKRRRVTFKQATDLTDKDSVAIIEELPIFGKVVNPYPYTCGLLIGDGYYGGTIEVIIDGPKCLNQVKAELGHWNIVHKRTHSTVVSYGLNGAIRQYLMKNGMHGQSKQTKRFPAEWRSYDRTSIALMLAGYFDADGNTKVDKSRGVSIVYSSVVKELLVDTREALIKFGIHSSIVQELSKGGYTDQHVIYRLYINRAESVENFRKYIPIKSPHKIVPMQSKRVSKLLRDAEFIKTEQYADNPHLKPLTGAVLYRVISVTPIGEQDIYNLNAGNTHTYLANNIITHNTGGEEGPGIEGLTEIYESPAAWDMLEFPNVYDEGMEATTCGYFVPCLRANTTAMDENGNVDIQLAIKLDNVERAKKAKSKDPRALDRRKAEYPRNATEALMRMSFNMYNISEIDAQIKRILSDKAIQGYLRNGTIIQGEKGPEFILLPNAVPITQYPHKNTDDLTGCLTVFERPIQVPYTKDDGTMTTGTPEGIYFITVDPVYKEDAEDLTSLFDIRVWKQYNTTDPANQGLPVAWWTARPRQLEDAYKILFLLAEWYNCTIQSEIAGGGQAIVDYARRHKLLHKLEYEISIDGKEISMNEARKNRSYFMNMTNEIKMVGLRYHADYTMEVRGVNENSQPILNIHRTYDLGLLREMRKYNDKRNADRISSSVIGMYMLKKKALEVAMSEDNESNKSFYNRRLFAETSYSGQGLGTTTAY